MQPILSDEQIEELKQFDTPTVSNAIESFGLRDRASGFLDHSIRCQFPELPVMVGYATTCVTVADAPRTSLTIPPEDYFDHILTIPEPRVAVSHDGDWPPGVGAFMGEVNGTMHQALGVVGHVTDGCARDLPQLREAGFPVFCLGPCVSHAHIHITKIGTPVAMTGVLGPRDGSNRSVTIHPGDLLHADCHGVCIIPHECAGEVARACREVIESEQEILSLCRSEGFTPEKLKQILRRRREAGH